MIAVAMLVVMTASAQHKNTFTERYNVCSDQADVTKMGDWTVTYNVNGHDVTVHNALNDYTFFFEKAGTWVDKEFKNGSKWEECKFLIDGDVVFLSHGLTGFKFFGMYVNEGNNLFFTMEQLEDTRADVY